MVTRIWCVTGSTRPSGWWQPAETWREPVSVATNSIGGGRNRSVMDRIVERGGIYDAWSDEPWVVDGAAVRVSLVCFAGKSAKTA